MAVRRSALLWWTVTIALGLITTLVVSSSLATATRAAQSWGAEREVWVVQRALEGGDVITSLTVRKTRLPRGVVPDGALDGAATPVGEATRVALHRGEVVLTSRLAGAGAHGVAALVPPGHRAIAVPNDEPMPTVRVGDRVDVLATFDVDGGESEPSVAVASGAEVLMVTARALTLAVVTDEAPRVAFALAKGAVTVALRGGAASAPPKPRVFPPRRRSGRSRWARTSACARD
jgi:Flp pilus assembly protein CpaB